MSAATDQAPILELGMTEWHAEHTDQTDIVAHLEKGEVLYFPLLPFHLTDEEAALLNPALVSPKRKNIMYQTDQDAIRGTADDISEAQKSALKGGRFKYEVRQVRF